jgi:HD-GYP domain-containing protein (c-di-GMP phosphodiesterase class II)
VLVCDAFHAMTSDRPYRMAMAEDEARSELVRHAGTQFDPVVVGALLSALDQRNRLDQGLVIGIDTGSASNNTSVGGRYGDPSGRTALQSA